MQHLPSEKVGTNFADKRRSLGRYSFVAGYGHGIIILNMLLDHLLPLIQPESFLEWTHTSFE
jgi:hypothetical protein